MIMQSVSRGIPCIWQEQIYNIAEVFLQFGTCWILLL